MEFIKSEKLKYEYSRFNEETNENESIEALKGLDITIDSGEFVAVLGHNGSGKSTFAKLINGLYSPKDGVLIVNGYDTKVQEYMEHTTKRRYGFPKSGQPNYSYSCRGRCGFWS